jgi:hypothetical protein
MVTFISVSIGAASAEPASPNQSHCKRITVRTVPEARVARTSLR